MTGAATDPDAVVIARRIQPRLPALLSARRASEVADALADLLSQADAGRDVTAPIGELLDRYRPTREWVEAYRRQGRPPEDRMLAGAPPGVPVVAPSEVLVCPTPLCGWQWRPLRAGPPPRCPVHDCVPVRAPAP